MTLQLRQIFLTEAETLISFLLKLFYLSIQSQRCFEIRFFEERLILLRHHVVLNL
jgi:hypothetical protein